MSTSLKVVSVAAVCWAWTSRSAMRLRSGVMGTTSSSGCATVGAWTGGCGEGVESAATPPCSRSCFRRDGEIGGTDSGVGIPAGAPCVTAPVDVVVDVVVVVVVGVDGDGDVVGF